jgi:hypothetical protein
LELLRQKRECNTKSGVVQLYSDTVEARRIQSLALKLQPAERIVALSTHAGVCAFATDTHIYIYDCCDGFLNAVVTVSVLDTAGGWDLAPGVRLRHIALLDEAGSFAAVLEPDCVSVFNSVTLCVD